MNRIDTAWKTLQEKGEKAFIPYICAGVPGTEQTVTLALDLSEAGAAILELGYPFSDPMADGPVNQQAAQIALTNGITSTEYFNIIKTIRKSSNIPVVVFSYLNPIFRMGYEKFCSRAAEAGADGILCVDMPVEESRELREQCHKNNLHLIYLVAPTTDQKRLEKVMEQASGFIYYVSRTGVTGEQKGFQKGFDEKLKKVKEGVSIPVAVGFGISKPEHVEQAAKISDGVIVGSALVKITMQNLPFEQMRKSLKKIAGDLIWPLKKK